MLLDRKEDMRAMASALRDELTHFERFGVNEDLNPDLLEPIRNRLRNTPLRAYFAQKMFLIIRDRLGWNKRLQRNLSVNEKHFTIKIPFVFELIITIQYLHNQVLDQKNGIDNLEKASRNMLTANILKDSLYEYIESEFPKKMAADLTRAVRQAFKLVDIGQLIEKQYNSYQQFQKAELMDPYHFSKSIDASIDFSGIAPFTEQLKKDLPISYNEFTDLYLKRIYLTCAALFTICTDFLCSTLGLDKEQHTNLRQFATAYGMMRQIINDNADLVPSVYGLATLSKAPEDAFSDLKNRNITLPLIYHLSSNPSGPVAHWLRGKDYHLSVAREEEFAHLILSDHSLFKSIQLSRLLANISESYLNGTSEAESLISDTCQIAWWNKFLAPVVKTKAYKKFKKTAWYRQMKKRLTREACLATEAAHSAIRESENTLTSPNLIFSFR